jgi:hypothetical protein
MVATILSGAGLDPTIVIGGRLGMLGSNAKLGKGELLVAEADESDGSFLRLSPTIAVVTNIDPEHLDHYGTIGTLQRAFVDFLNKVPFYGCGIVCLDEPRVQEILPSLQRRVDLRLLVAGRSLRLERAAARVPRLVRRAAAGQGARARQPPGAGTPQRRQRPGLHRRRPRVRGAVRDGDRAAGVVPGPTGASSSRARPAASW